MTEPTPDLLMHFLGKGDHSLRASPVPGKSRDAQPMSGVEDCAELTRTVLERLDMIIAGAPTEQAHDLMLAAAYLQHAHDLLDRERAA